MSYIATRTGNHIDFKNLGASVFIIEDIARGLSNECRFAGQLSNFYSVAQHSVYVSQLVPAEFALEALLHDATEAYMKDIPSPLKAILPDYKMIEAMMNVLIRKQFKLPLIQSEVVHYADLVMLATERRDFEIDLTNNWSLLEGIPPSDVLTINPLAPNQAYFQFMSRFNKLVGRQEFDVDIN